MVKYSCETCQKTFTQKGHFEKHMSRKTPCKKDNTIEVLVEQKVKEVLSKSNMADDKKNESSTNQEIKLNQMDYTNKTREELIAICKEKGIKGYSGKKKEDILKLLDNFILSSNSLIPNSLIPNKIRYIDLFCGLGAFHTAFNESPEFECVLACDIDEGVRTIYKENYNIEPKSDIRNIDVSTIPDFEILCAGFPCQPFSIAGNGEGFNDREKGNLFFDILKIIDSKHPSMCILENVKNLKTHDSGNTYNRIESELKKRGYLITSKVINSAEYGSPQARHRIFIVATRNKAFKIPNGNNTQIIIKNIIDLSVMNNDINPEKYILKSKPKKNNVFGKPNVIFDVISNKSKKGGRQGERVYSIDSVGITICASSGGPGAKTGLYKVGDNVRRLTVKETLRMFGFPDTYRFTSINNEDKLFYLGNSIVVNVISAFVPVIKNWFNRL